MPRSFAAIEAERKTLREKRETLADQIRAINNAAGDNPLDPGQQQRWDNLARGVDKIDVELGGLDDEWRDGLVRGLQDGSLRADSGNANERALDGVRGTTNGGPWAQRSNAHTNPQELRGRALRAIELTDHATDGMRQTATKLVETDRSGLAARWAVASSNPHYLTAFEKLVVDPERGHLEWHEAERDAFATARSEQRALSVGTPADGGYMVPFTLDPAIILTGAGTINPVRAIARQVTIATNAWNGVSSAGVTAGWKTEAAQATDDAPTLAQPDVPVHRGDAFIPYSFEAGQDIPGFVQEMTRLLMDAKDTLEATALTTGSGSDEPTGFVTALAGSASEVDPQVAETFSVNDVYALLEALPARFRARGQWVASLPIINLIRKFGTADSHAMIARLAEGRPETLLGHLLHEASDMDTGFNAAASADNHILTIGDWSNYVVVDRIGATIELVPHLFGANNRPTGQRGLYMFFRTGGDVVNVNGFRQLNVATTA